MPLPRLCICIITGILPLFWLPTLPAFWTIIVVLGSGFVLAAMPLSVLRYVGFTTVFFGWGLLAAYEVVQPAETLAGRDRQVEVTIATTDGVGKHEGFIIRHDGRRLFPAPGVKLYSDALPEPVCGGQRWAMTLRLRPVHSLLNEGGFDGQRYALSQNKPVTGRVLSARLLDGRCSLRARYLDSLSTTLEDYPWKTVILALGMGERVALSAEIKWLMRQTGIAHLMAISGLHIGLAGSLGWLLARAVQFFLPCRWVRWYIPPLVGLAGAILYATLSGLQPPALRTIVGMSLWMLLRLSGVQWTAWQVWLCCIAGILVVDPLAILSDSLWLSALAVAALIFWFQWLPFPPVRAAWGLNALKGLVYIQLGMTLLLLPMQVALFHGVSLTSMLANLLAVPLVTFVVVPIILAGMILHLSGPAGLEQLAWYLADRLLALMFYLLALLPDGWLSLDGRWLWAMLLPWLVVIVWRLRLWQACPAVCLTLPVLLTFPLWQKKPDDSWSVHMLDVGHGLALAIVRHGRAILYDTGPAWPGGDAGQQVIDPWLRWHNIRVDGMIISHSHLDHRGGLRSLQTTWPNAWVRSPLGWEGHLPCQRGVRWQWQGLTFSVHWPLPGNRDEGNNGSCVVKVDDGRHSILLTGDIEAPAEAKMLSHYWTHLAATLIQVPHHGSRTSSTVTLLQRVKGSVALASTSRFNAWRLPSKSVVERYRQQGYKWLDTPHEGQVTVVFSAGTWQVHSLRRDILPRWYHQRFGARGDNG